VERSRR